MHKKGAFSVIEGQSRMMWSFQYIGYREGAKGYLGPFVWGIIGGQAQGQ